MALSVAVLAVVVAVYLVAAVVQQGESWDRRRASIVVLPLGAGITYARTQIEGGSLSGFVHLSTFAIATILVASLGRPARVVDLSFAGTEAEQQDQRRQKQVRRTQYAFCGLAVAAVLVYTFTGGTFLD